MIPSQGGQFKTNTIHMKKLVFLAALAAMVLACAKYTSDEHESSGIYLNGERVVSIGSTFMGGAIANPSKGSSHRCHMYEKNYEHGPNWDVVASVVSIHGFRYTGVTYSAPGQFIDGIGIYKDVLNLDSHLYIPLEQGAYKGGCELVSAVRITNYDGGTVKDQKTGAMNDDGKIDIAISLTDGRTLRIHYRGKVPYDGYY
jgi:hypothetical protein